MGTFVLRADTGNSDIDFQAGGAGFAASNSGTADGAFNLRIQDSTNIISCGGVEPRDFMVLITPSLFLDGSSTPITGVNDPNFPLGFVVDDATIEISASWNGGNDQYINSNSDGSIIWDSQDIGPTLERSTNNPVTTFTVPTSIVITPPISNLELFGLFGWRCSYTDGMNLAMDRLVVTGNYHVLAFTFDIDPPSGSTVNANTPNSTDDGTLITLSSDPDDPAPLDFTHLTLSVACGTVVIKTQTENLLEFYIPASCGVSGGTVIITATGDGTQFSGSVPLASMIVLVTNGSGIYVITPGNTHDVIYDSARDGTTRNVKIPNPTVKTGFVGG